MAVKMSMLVFRADDGDSIFFRNFGVYRQVYTALQSRIQTSTSVLVFRKTLHFHCACISSLARMFELKRILKLCTTVKVRDNV